MILRRVIEHVKTQNWVAVGLDFIIVVMGVFIGLQVQAWSVERERQKNERDYLARLHGEIVQLLATRETYDQSRVQLSADLLHSVELLYRTSDDTALTPEQCDSIAGSAHTTVPPSELPTVTELLSTGGLDQLTSVSVRTAVLNFMQDAARARDLIATINKSGRDLGKAYPAYIMHHVGPSRLGIDSLWLNPICNAAAMRADPAFMNELSENAYMYNVYTERAILPVSRQLANLHDVIDAETGVDHRREEIAAP